jgi:two-component system response regulator AlgR
MKILIVDDERPARDRLKRLLTPMEGCEIVGEARNGQEAVDLNRNLGPDLILLDIRMPGMDGLEAARIISQQSRPPAIIFTTAFSDHALEAFETHAMDYLLKPVKVDRLREAIDASARLNRMQMQDQIETLDTGQSRKHICARVRGNLVLIDLADIFYFQAEQKYVTVRHKGGEVLIEEPLKALEQEFADHFYRIHRNALVRLDRIAGMKNSAGSHQVFFHDIDETLEVSRRHLPGVRKVLKGL